MELNKCNLCSISVFCFLEQTCCPCYRHTDRLRVGGRGEHKFKASSFFEIMFLKKNSRLKILTIIKMYFDDVALSILLVVCGPAALLLTFVFL